MDSSHNLDTTLLRARVRGEVITPADEGFDEARKLFYGGLDNRPAALVRVADADDVAAALRFTRDNGIEFAVRSGGHNAAGHSGVDGGLVIDLRGLKGIDIDVSGRTAWAGTGLTAAEFSNAVGEHGLAVGFGDSGSVGIGGITLGGGVGFLARKYGLTVDSLLAVEIVTATGEVLLVDDENHPDLFWAIRGGGGNFGVATRFQYALQPVGQVVGGLLVLPADPATVAGFIALSEEAPEELTTMANVMSAPPMPFLPEELVGETVVIGLILWCGDIPEGKVWMDRFRALAEPLFDMLDEMPYPQIYQPEEEDYQPLATALTGFTERIDAAKIATALEEIEASDAAMRVVQLRVLGGGIAKVPNDATAYAHRERKFMVNVASFYDSEAERPTREAWVRNLSRTLTEGDGTGYVGFLADEGADRVRDAYPGATWERLREVKAKYDPENVFHRNQNIPPATS